MHQIRPPFRLSSVSNPPLHRGSREVLNEAVGYGLPQHRIALIAAPRADGRAPRRSLHCQDRASVRRGGYRGSLRISDEKTSRSKHRILSGAGLDQLCLQPVHDRRVDDPSLIPCHEVGAQGERPLDPRHRDGLGRTLRHQSGARNCVSCLRERGTRSSTSSGKVRALLTSLRPEHTGRCPWLAITAVTRR